MIKQTKNDNTKQKIDQLLASQNETDSPFKTLSHLKKNNVYINFGSIGNELEVLSFLKSFEIPEDLENIIPDALIKKYYTRFLSLSPSHLMDFKSPSKYAMISIFYIKKSDYVMMGYLIFL